jgi:hypothetical protein
MYHSPLSVHANTKKPAAALAEKAEIAENMGIFTYCVNVAIQNKTKIDIMMTQRMIGICSNFLFMGIRKKIIDAKQKKYSWRRFLIIC